MRRILRLAFALAAAALLVPVPATSASGEREERAWEADAEGFGFGVPLSGLPTIGPVPILPFGTGILPPPTPHYGAVVNTTLVYAFGTDVDRDGAADVLAVTQSADRTHLLATTFEARRGSDNATLWSFALGTDVFWAAYLRGDLTGDGVGDLALVTREDERIVWTYPPPGMFGLIQDQSHVVVATQRLLLVDGATGALLWEDARESRDAKLQKLAPQVLFWARLRAWESHAKGVGVDAMDDVDGDGARDLLWQPWDLVFTNGQNARIVHARAYSSLTGALLWQRELVGTVMSEQNPVFPAFLELFANPVVAGAWIGPDATGDGRRDLFTSETIDLPGSPLVVRRAVDAGSGHAAWTTVSPIGDPLVPPGGYLVLDGATPTLLWRTGGVAGVPLRASALDPATGASVWARVEREAQEALYAAGDVNADGRGDALLASAHAEGPDVLTFRAVDGATGATLWTRPVPLVVEGEEIDWLFGSAPVADHTGEGVRDLFFGEGHASGGSLVERWHLVDLATGADHWSTTRNATYLTFVFPVPQAAPGGAAPLGTLALEYADGEERLHVGMREGATGAARWTREPHRAGPDADVAWVVYAAAPWDATGDGEPDLVVGSWDILHDEAPQREIVLLDGATGGAYTRYA